MLFQDILRLHDISPKDVALCLHKPSDPRGRRALAIMAEERPDLFEAYQSTHAGAAEATVRRCPYFASFLTMPTGDAVFLGLFRREIGATMTRDDWLTDPLRREMLERVDGHHTEPAQRAAELAGRTLFALHRLDGPRALEKRLICADPGGRAYMRRAETTPLEVREIRRQGRVAPPLPDWSELTLDRQDLRALPQDWAATLRNWRGIYLIVDDSDGQHYVGSAYGTENLLGRWQHHVAGDSGVTAELRLRDPGNFRFSILELLAPTAVIEDVVARENSWKLRLDTRRHGLNGN